MIKGLMTSYLYLNGKIDVLGQQILKENELTFFFEKSFIN